MKRFWQAVTLTEAPGGHGIALDGRPVRTPARAPLVLPGRALAQAVADEWAAVGERVDPAAMPLTRAANVAIDRVMPEREAVAAAIAAYGGSDLLCYRAPRPPALAAQQAAGWDPLLDWAAERYGARLAVTAGVMPVAQEPDTLARMAAAVAGLDAWALTALHAQVTVTGSLVLGLAVSKGRLTGDRAWALSRIEEHWNIAQWGEDAEAAALAARRQADLDAACALTALLAAR